MFQYRRFFAASPLVLAVAVLAPSIARAQTGQTSSTAQQAAATLNRVETTPQSQQARARVLREAQARVQARRRLRAQQIARQTYSHRYEVYGGGGYLRFRPGHFLQHNTEAAWNGGFTDWVRGKLGATVDFRGYYGTAITNNFQYQVFKPSISEYTFLIGPQYRFFEGQHWGWSALVLAGAAHGNFGTGTGGFPGTLVGLYPDDTKFALTAGAAVDYNLSPSLALRLTPNFLLTTFGGDQQKNLGFNVGVVYRFGRQ